MRALLLLIALPLFSELIDLDEKPQDFVLETRKIEVPEFPHAFNPSIIRWEGRLLLSFRSLPDLQDKFKSDIYLVWLDEEFNPSSQPQLLDLRPWNSSIPCRAEDARLIQIQNQLCIVYSDNAELKVTGGGFRMFIAQLEWNKDKFFAIHSERLSDWEGEDPNRREKNWVPFDYRDELFLAYSPLNNFILRPLFGTESCETVVQAKNTIDWGWGDLRGGTPGLLIGDEYLAFFHSVIKMPSVHSEGKIMPHYFMGAYTFSNSPPFNITQISPEPIWAKNFYSGLNYERYWGSVRVVFPCGFFTDEKFIWITYGRQDHELWIVKLDKQGLLKSLIPIGIS